MLTKANNIHSRPTRQVGFVLKTHGFNGQLKIELDEDYSLNEFLLLEINGKFVPFAIQSFNQNSGLLKLSNMDSIEEVEELINLPILDFVDEQEDSLNTLVNYTLLDQISGMEFTINQIIEYPSNLLIEFRHEFKDVLIPYHPDIILNIDHDEKKVTAKFPDGILDL
jgi:ribosomal 30S subunit maturation factor RimM